MLSWVDLNLMNSQYGDSFFVFDENKFRNNFKNLVDEFATYYPKTKIAYSYKTNYTPYICKLVSELGGFAEIVSEMELWLARRLKVKYANIIYNGPYKSLPSLRDAALNGAIINIDSWTDINNLIQIAIENPNTIMKVAIRCNFAVDEKIVSRFGFDVESPDIFSVVLALSAVNNINLAGLHCHFPNRDLDSYRIRVDRMIKLVRDLFYELPEFINIGGGYFSGLPKSLSDSLGIQPPTFKDYACVIAQAMACEFPDANNSPTLFLEPGTALVADTMRFYSRIVAIKKVREKNIAIASGSIFNISPIARSVNLPLTVIRSPNSVSSDVGTYDIAGYTCIESDYLTKNYHGNISVNDYLMYENVGSYSIVMKPPFILPNVPILKVQDGIVDVIKKGESFEYIFENFSYL